MRQLLFAVGPLVLDSLGIIVFAVLMAMKVDVIAATVAGAAVACIVVGWAIVRRRPVQAMQWLSLALVVVSATATMLTRDPRFVMAKPTVLYVVIGAAMLKRGWMNRYVPPDELAVVEDLMTGFGFVWAGLMFLTAAANLVVAVAFTPWWPSFLGVFPLASKLALFGFQFLFVRVVAEGRTKAGGDMSGVLSGQ